MAVQPSERKPPANSLTLEAFLPRDAAKVLSWVCGDHDAYLLAPRTPPPLTIRKLLQWSGPGRSAYLLEESSGEAVGYGELNLLSGPRRQYWLGHLLIDPARRGAGLGRRLTELLLERAFCDRQASRVALVVFEGNDAARRCYLAAGMVEDGYETHYFPHYGRHVRLLRMVATRAARERARIR